jgi:superfamily II DNA or RNA helicase
MDMDMLVRAILQGSVEHIGEVREQLHKVYNNKNYNNKYKSYQSVESPTFQSSLLSKKEFIDRKIAREDTIDDFEKAAYASCITSDGDFKLSESQAFVRNYISPRTPYNSLLLYHDVGVGKTCSAISIAERFPDFKCIIIAPLNVQSAFRAQMFDVSKLSRTNDRVTKSNQCTAFRFVDGNTSDDDATIDARAQKMINSRYAFTGFKKFANMLAKLSDDEIVEQYNKYVFIVDEAHNLRSQKDESKPAYAAMKRLLKLVRGNKLILLTATPMFNDPREVLDLVNLLLVNDGRKPLKKKTIFDKEGNLIDGESLIKGMVGYVSHVSGRNPLRFPVILTPDSDGDANVLKVNAIPRLDVHGNLIPVEHRIKDSKIVGSVMSPFQYQKYVEHSGTKVTYVNVKVIENEDDTSDIPPSFRPGFEVSNVSFPIDNGAKDSSSLFWSCFRRVPGKEFAVNYVPDIPRFLAMPALGTYSCKFKTIIDRIATSEGIVFVYSRFLWAGLIPFAIALEHAGYGRHGRRNILNETNGYDYGRYIILTSDNRICNKSTFASDLASVVREDNKDGNKIKIILACGVATEGIDFKCVRSVHLIDPWYHSNKVSQIIGRASRNCSHGYLVPNKRTVTVYMHAATGSDRETVDINAYRISEVKQRRISAIENIMKSVSVDCVLNKHAQQDEALKLSTIDLHTAQGTVLKNYRVGRNLNTSEGICIVDSQSNSSKEETEVDESTHDPWYHAEDLVEKRLSEIIQEYGKRGTKEFYLDDLRKDDDRDTDIFMTALQRGIDTNRLSYRGGMYIVKKEVAPSTCHVLKI